MNMATLFVFWVLSKYAFSLIHFPTLKTAKKGICSRYPLELTYTIPLHSCFGGPEAYVFSRQTTEKSKSLMWVCYLCAVIVEDAKKSARASWAKRRIIAYKQID